VACARKRHHARVAQLSRLAAELFGRAEWVRLALNDKDRAPDPGPVLGPELVREPWAVERVGEEQETRELIPWIRRREARDSTSIGAASDHDVGTGA
jgi:hypothetical protein